MLHLSVLFDSSVLSFSPSLVIDFLRSAYLVLNSDHLEFSYYVILSYFLYLACMNTTISRCSVFI